MRLFKTILVTSILSLCVISPISAKYTQTCKAKYKANYGWSQYYTVEVTFLSGSELNKATKSWDYSSYTTYAVIFWGDGEASVIEISSYTGCGSEVTQRCITNKFSNLEGEDQQGRGWEVCVKSTCY
jgi:hypothetical protein